MTVLIGALSSEGIILAADRQMTNKVTNEIISTTECKIDQISDTVAVAGGGSKAICVECFNALKQEIAAKKIDPRYAEDVAKTLIKIQTAIPIIYQGTPLAEMEASFIVGGLQRNRDAVLVKLGKDTPNGKYEILEYNPYNTQFVICSPSDLQQDQVAKTLVDKFKLSSKAYHASLEDILRSTIRQVSGMSSFVSEDSDLWCIDLQSRKGEFLPHNGGA